MVLNNIADGLTVSKLLVAGCAALNNPASPNFTASAVVAKNEPCTSKLEPGPNTMPLGLIKNKLALPTTPNRPNISERFAPVTREALGPANLRVEVQPLRGSLLQDMPLR